MTDLVTNITIGVYYFILASNTCYWHNCIRESFSTRSGRHCAKKVVYSVFSVPLAKKIHDGAALRWDLHGFISGKNVDSTIIGRSVISLLILGLRIRARVCDHRVTKLYRSRPFIGAIPSPSSFHGKSLCKDLEFAISSCCSSSSTANILGQDLESPSGCTGSG
jgi:hypothetical protein